MQTSLPPRSCATSALVRIDPPLYTGFSSWNRRMRGYHRWILVLLALVAIVEAGTPAPENFFNDQLVDHINPKGSYHGLTWSQRYYVWDKEFTGPGSPIFIILGGEGNIEPDTGLFYPFVTHHLAKVFGAYVLEPEHRFYGKSQPVSLPSEEITPDPRVELFTPEQALYDAMYLLDDIAQELGCSKDKFSKDYCPVVTIGGSYPGWLAAMARVLFPHKVDMAYAASAPMTFYSQRVDQYDYYNLITTVAEDTLPGCADGVRAALYEVRDWILNGHYDEGSVGVCAGSTPNYVDPSIKENLPMLVDELMMVVEYTFANANMGNYPPSKSTMLYLACETFTTPGHDSFEKLRDFLVMNLPPWDTGCWNMSEQLPSGQRATITSGDWSGVGTGGNGESWDFQTCTLLVEAIGLSEESMFPPRVWTLSWLHEHCQNRFGVTPKPYELVQRWKFDQLVETNVTRILFTNGLKDGWSVGGIRENLSESLPVINFPNGAHHSDLSGRGPSDEDSDDIQQGFRDITEIIGKWLDDVKGENTAPNPT